MRLLPELVDGPESLAFLLRWSQNWRENLFGLDCLPRLYAKRVAQLSEAQDSRAADAIRDALFALVGDAEFLTRRARASHLCGPLVEDVHVALAVALEAFCPAKGGRTKPPYLPEVVQFGLLRPWVRMRQGVAGPSVAKLAWDGHYPQAIRLAQLVGDEVPETTYLLLLLIAWIAARKSGTSRLAQERTQADQAHLQHARLVLAEALRIDARYCGVPRTSRGASGTPTRDVVWEVCLMDLATTLLTAGVEAEAIEIIRRFGERGYPALVREGAAAAVWKAERPPGGALSPAKPYAAAHYLLTASSQLAGDTRKRLVARAEELARGRPDAFEGLVWVAVAYAAAGAAARAGQLYNELLDRWAEGTAGEPAAGEPSAVPEPSAFVHRQATRLDALLVGLEQMGTAPWMPAWCAKLQTAAAQVSLPGYPVAIPLRAAEACVLCGDRAGAERLLTPVVQALGGKTESDTEGEVIERLTRVAQRVSTSWQGAHLLSLLHVAARCVEKVAQDIAACLDEWERLDSNDSKSDQIEYVELPSLFTDLRTCAQSACALMRVARESAVPALSSAQQAVIRSIHAVCRLSPGYRDYCRWRTMILLAMAVDLWAMGEPALAAQALSPAEASIERDFSNYEWESQDGRSADWEGWADVFRTWHRRCPELWTFYPRIRHTLTTALTVEREPARSLEQQLAQILRSHPCKSAKSLEKRAIKIRQERYVRASETYTGRFLLALLAALVGQGEHHATVATYRLLCKGPWGLKVPEATLVAALRRVAFDPDIQREVARKAEENPEHCYLLAVMARALLEDEELRDAGATLFGHLRTSLRKDNEFWDEELAWELIGLADDAEDRGEQDLATLALGVAQRFSEREAEGLRIFRSRDPHGSLSAIFAELEGILTPRQRVVLAAIARRLHRRGLTERGWTLFHGVLQGPFGDEIRAEVAKELWCSDDSDDSEVRHKAKELLALELRAIQDGLAQQEDPADLFSGLGVDMHQVVAVAEALVVLEKREDARALLERVLERKAAEVSQDGIGLGFGIPEAVVALAKRGCRDQARRLADTLFARDEAELAAVYLALADLLSSNAEREAMLHAIKDRRGPQWIPVQAKLWSALQSMRVEDRQRQLAALLHRPESREWGATDALLASLLTLGDAQGQPGVPPGTLRAIHQLCDRLAAFPAQGTDSPA